MRHIRRPTFIRSSWGTAATETRKTQIPFDSTLALAQAGEAEEMTNLQQRYALQVHCGYASLSRQHVFSLMVETIGGD